MLEICVSLGITVQQQLRFLFIFLSNWLLLVIED